MFNILGLVEYLQTYGLSGFIIVAIIAMLPIAELRLSIPVGIFIFKLPFLSTFIVSIFFNIIIVPLILILLSSITKLISKSKPGKKFVDFIFERARRRSSIVEKYEYTGLMAFVSIPLPGTGAWTGMLISYLLALKYKRSVLFISLGVIIAGIAITALSLLIQYGIIENAGIFLGKF